MESAKATIVHSTFKPAPWLKNRHLQTLFSSLPWSCRIRPAIRRESLELPDGDVTAIDWALATDDLPRSAPVLVILHGLESSAQSAYARLLMQAAIERQWRCCVLHFRDCGDYRNRLPRRYHAGETGDLRFFLDHLRQAGHAGPLLSAGYSLGGNVLLKYLGEAGQAAPLTAAAAVSVPFSLDVCAEALNSGFSKVYQKHLLQKMKSAAARKFGRDTSAFDWQRAMAARTFAEFDDAVTAPLHGFANKDDYYRRCSSLKFLRDIATPTLIVNALDDPFMTPDIVPTVDDLSPHVLLEVAPSGGHVGFVSGGSPWRPSYYLPGRLTAFFAAQLATRP